MFFFFEEDDTNENEIFDESRKLVMDNVDRTIKDVLNEITEGKININPDYQRNYVWNTVQSSKLIESILINIPIPNIYLSQTMTGTWEVIDGVQRLTTLKKFFSNEYELKGLEVLPELNKKKYDDLSEEIKNYLDDKIIRYVRIKNESSEDIKFDVFMRLNQGSIKLNEQELRNCLYRGELNDLLKRISESSNKYNSLLAVKDESSVKVRMKTVELLLRALAFNEAYENGFENYSGRIKKQLNEYMFKNQNNIDGVETKLNKGIENLYNIFDGKEQKAFRLKSENIINLSLSETQLIVASKLEDGFDVESVYNVFMECLSDEKFIDHLKNATGNTTRVKYRYEFLVSKLSDAGINLS